jgi:VIT1/CCC1 family predicted Fe2+/Mn2+ transporter
MAESRLSHAHTPAEIAARLAEGHRHSYLRDWVYGGIDGAVTTFAVVSGVVGAKLPAGTILILGAANLVADGFSMAASNYLGTKAERDEFELVEEFERRQVSRHPEGEREEVRQILARQGFEGELLERATVMYTSDPAKWVRLMLTEEYGLPASIRSPWRAGWATFNSFAVCGAIPLAPYLAGTADAFAWSCVLTGGVFFLIGSLKSRWSIASWWKQGLQTFAVGAAAAVLAYIVGALLHRLAGNAGGA